MTYNPAEFEAIGLCIAIEALDDIVNKSLIEIRGESSVPCEVEVYFHSYVHQELFLIRTLDFVKEGGDRSLTGVNGSCLEVLEAACSTASFDVGGSVTALETPTRALREWLFAETPFNLWLPTLNIEARLNIPRLDFLFISGNQSKHNLSRLTRLAKRLSNILTDHGHSVLPEQIPLALDDFREHLQEDYFIYYGTWLSELLNELRWGIQNYLRPFYELSYEPDSKDPIMYSFNYPETVVNDVPKSWFWRLMNHVRSEPYLKRFSGAPYLKKEVIR